MVLFNGFLLNPYKDKYTICIIKFLKKDLKEKQFITLFKKEPITIMHISK